MAWFGLIWSAPSFLEARENGCQSVRLGSFDCGGGSNIHFKVWDGEGRWEQDGGEENLEAKRTSI